MKKISFRVRNFDEEKFLTFNIDNDAELDEELLDFLEDEEPEGIVPVIFEEDEEFDTFSYDITDKIRLSELSAQEINAEMVLMVLRGLVISLMSMSDYRIPLSYLVLNRHYIYIDSDYKVEFVCIPLEDMKEEVDLTHFLRNFISSLRFEPTENGDYVAKLLTYVNDRELFNLHNMLSLVEEWMDKLGIEIPEGNSNEIYGEYTEVQGSEAKEDSVDASMDDQSALETPEEENASFVNSDLYEDALASDADDSWDAETQPEDVEADADAVEEESEWEAPSSEEAFAGEEQYEDDNPEEETEESTNQEDEASSKDGSIKEEEPEYGSAAEDDSAADDVEQDSIADDLNEYYVDAQDETLSDQPEESNENGDQDEIIDEEDVWDADEEDVIIQDAADEQKAVEADAADEQEDAEAADAKPDFTEEDDDEAEDAASKKDSGKNKETPVVGVVIEDDLDAFLAQKEKEDMENNEDPAFKVHKNIKINRASIVKNTQEELKSAEENESAEASEDEVKETAEEAAEKEKPKKEKPKRERAKKAKKESPKKDTSKKAEGEDTAEDAVEQQAEAAEDKADKEEDKSAKDEKENKEGAGSIFSHTLESAANSIKNAASSVVAPPKVNPYLIRVNTNERIMIGKQTFKLGKAVMGVDYSISGNGAVSRVHAIITGKDGEYFIKDNKSTNHTFVNGKAILDGESVALTDDCRIMLGDEEFIFKLQ